MRATGQLLFCFLVMLSSARAAAVMNASASISGRCSAAETRSGTTAASATATCGDEFLTATATGDASVTENLNPAAFEIVLNASGSGDAFGIGSAEASADAEYFASLIVLGGPLGGEMMAELSYGGFGGNYGRILLNGTTFFEEDSPLSPFEATIPFAYTRGVPFDVSLFARASGGSFEGLPPDPGGARLSVVLNAPGASITVVPEPGSIGLTLMGAVLLVCQRWKCRRDRDELT